MQRRVAVTKVMLICSVNENSILDPLKMYVFRLGFFGRFQKVDNETFLDIVDPIVDSASDPSFPKFAVFLLQRLLDLLVVPHVVHVPNAAVCFRHRKF